MVSFFPEAPLPISLFMVQLDITFPALACSVVTLDAMDVSGEQHLDVVWHFPFRIDWIVYMVKLFLYLLVWSIFDASILLYFWQKHNVFKKRLDSTGRVVEPPKQEHINGGHQVISILFKIISQLR